MAADRGDTCGVCHWGCVQLRRFARGRGGISGSLLAGLDGYLAFGAVLKVLYRSCSLFYVLDFSGAAPDGHLLIKGISIKLNTSKQQSNSLER